MNYTRGCWKLNHDGQGLSYCNEKKSRKNCGQGEEDLEKIEYLYNVKQKLSDGNISDNRIGE